MKDKKSLKEYPEAVRQRDMPGTRTGYYDNNPLNIKFSDLDNVDIVIK